VATTAALVLGVASISAAALIGAALVVIIASYLAVSIAYSLGLKRVPIVELACVGSGFTLRAVAGGAATHVAISGWFLVMTSFGALLVVAGKRTSEKSLLGERQGAHRKVLDSYPTRLLGGLRLLAISVTVSTYCLWAFERADGLRGADRSAALVWFELSIIPFVLAVLALERAFIRGRGGQPEELALSDRLLQFLGIVWVALVLCGIYA
jgi:decaprenyl-phosphate phosphoribosyltransferase